MFRMIRQVKRGSAPWSLLLQFSLAGRSLLTATAIVTLVLAFTRTAVSQTNTQQRGLGPSLAVADLIALRQQCWAAEPLSTSFHLVQQHACRRSRLNTGQILAFEENHLFIYALSDMSGTFDSKDTRSTQKAAKWIRRFFMLKPSTFVVEDLIRNPRENSTRWSIKSIGEPMIGDGRIRWIEAGNEIFSDSLLPLDANTKKTSFSGDNPSPAHRIEVLPKQVSHEARFLQVFHVRGTTVQYTPLRPTMTEGDKQLELTVATRERTFRLMLPLESSTAGKIEVTAADGESLLPNRLLPSGIMPHGPEGARLLERWDAPYRRDRLPGWDVGQPSSHMIEAVDNRTFRPGRAIVLGCGTGTNAIYLANGGFEVTGVDVAPTALTIGMEKASRAGVKIDWIVADVVSLPKLKTFDLIFDRGCYHHICQYNSAAYVETLRRLSHPNTQVLILAGSPADGERGGPPRVKEETIRNDFSALFEFEWLRGIRFDTRDPNTQGPSAWSIHLRRKDN